MNVLVTVFALALIFILMSARELAMKEVRPNVWRIPMDEWHERNPAVMDKIFSSGQVPTEFHVCGTMEEVHTMSREEAEKDKVLQTTLGPAEVPEEEPPAEEVPEEEVPGTMGDPYRPPEEEAPAEEPPEEEKPNIDWLKADLIAHAEGMQLNVDDHMTKQEILDLILTVWAESPS